MWRRPPRPCRARPRCRSRTSSIELPVMQAPVEPGLARLQQQLAGLLPAIAARAAEIEAARRLPADLATALARAGVFRMLVPRSLGGLELPPAAAMQIL